MQMILMSMFLKIRQCGFYSWQCKTSTNLFTIIPVLWFPDTELDDRRQVTTFSIYVSTGFDQS